jgi:hypothetical protein
MGDVRGIEPSRRRQRRVVIVLVVALGVVIAALAVLARRDDRGEQLVVEPQDVRTTDVPEVEAHIPWYAMRPLAVGGGDVWLARGGEVYELGVTNPGVVVERRDPVTTKVKATINVAQETVFGIGADDTQVYVAGGGDGGVPDTTVSAIDMQTNAVAWTRTLEGASCSCPVVAGAGGVWLGGNGSAEVLRLDPETGELVAKIALPSPAMTYAFAVVGDHVEVGLQDGSVAVIGPARNFVSRLTREDDASTSRVTAIVPVGREGFVLFDDGSVDHVEALELAPTERAYKMTPQDGAAGTRPGDMWVVGGDRLGRTGRETETFVYDWTSRRFSATTDKLLFQRAQTGFSQVVAVGDRLWIFGAEPDVEMGTYPNPAVIVVRLPNA